MGVEVREADATWDAKRDVQVAADMRGPGSSEISETDDAEAQDRCPVWTRYRCMPFVDGKPYSRAMASSIHPMVGCRGSRRPRRQRLRLCSLLAEVDGGRREMGGTTVSKHGDERVGVLVAESDGLIERIGDACEPDGGGVGKEGTSIPNDWAIRPN